MTEEEIKELRKRAKENSELRAELSRNPGVLRLFAFAEKNNMLFGIRETVAEEGPIFAKDIEDAGFIEPRLLEVLPTLFLKKGLKVEDEENLPEDIKEIVFKGLRPEKFRGLDYKRWL